MSAVGCEEFSEMAPDVALGLVSGDERAHAIDHLDRCQTCRDELEELMRVADRLLLLAPLGEPPIGFETRVMDRLARLGAFSGFDAVPPALSTDASEPADPFGGDRGSRRTGRRSAWRPAVLVAAIVVVVAVTAGLLVGRTATPRSPMGAQAVEVRADDNTGICRLVAFAKHQGRPAELVIHLDEPGEPASTYSVSADRASGGPAIWLGTIDVRNGQGSLDVKIPAGAGPVNGIRVIESGRVHYRATFTSV